MSLLHFYQFYTSTNDFVNVNILDGWLKHGVIARKSTEPVAGAVTGSTQVAFINEETTKIYVVKPEATADFPQPGGQHVVDLFLGVLRGQVQR